MKLKVNIALASLAVIALLAPSSAFATLTIGSASVISDGALTINGAVGSAVLFGSSVVGGSITVGGASQTGAMVIGQSNQSNTISIASGSLAASKVGTVNIASGANADATATKTVNIAENQFGAGATNVKIGNNEFGTGTNIIQIGNGFKLGGSTTIGIAAVPGGGTWTGDAVSIGNSGGNTSLTLQAGTGNVLIQGAVTTTYTMGTATGTGTITIGLSTASNTISIGSATTGAGNTQTINIGSAATGTGKATIVIGNTTATNASTVAIRSGLTGNSGGILLEGPLNYGAAADGDDDYDITILPAPSAYSTGMMIMFTVATANTDGATINVNSLGSKALVKGNNAVLATNDIIAGRTYIAVYDGTQFDLINPAVQ